MPDPITFESVDVSMSTHPKERRARSQTEIPFKLLIMGDFSGRANRGLATDGSDIINRRLYAVDRDCDDAVMEKMGTAVHIPSSGSGSPMVALNFAELDDFHPEQMYYHSPLFKTLKETRRKLLNPDTFAETAARFTQTPQAEARETAAGEGTGDRKPPVLPDIESPSGLLDQILDAGSDMSAGPADMQPRPASDWDRFLDDLVRPYLVPDIENAQDELVGSVDRAIAGTMNSILHHPDFQAVEANWRALRWILRRLETGEHLRVFLLDLTQAELAASLTGHENLADCAVVEKLAMAGQENSGQTPWSLIAGLYTFEKTKSDAVILARAGAMGQMLNAPFIAAAGASVIGCPNIAESPDPRGWTTQPPPEDEKAWRVVRGLPEAGWVGLVMPRMIIRLPYGEDSDPVDVFDFEEMSGKPSHNHYLWASPVFAAALVLGNSFSRSGWQFSRDLDNRIDGLPLHLVRRDGETSIQPCCEVLLSDRALSAMIDAGVMPLVSYRDQDRAALVRLQSISQMEPLLRGRWR